MGLPTDCSPQPARITGYLGGCFPATDLHAMACLEYSAVKPELWDLGRWSINRICSFFKFSSCFIALHLLLLLWTKALCWGQYHNPSSWAGPGQTCFCHSLFLHQEGKIDARAELWPLEISWFPALGKERFGNAVVGNDSVNMLAACTRSQTWCDCMTPLD